MGARLFNGSNQLMVAGTGRPTVPQVGCTLGGWWWLASGNGGTLMSVRSGLIAGHYLMFGWDGFNLTVRAVSDSGSGTQASASINVGTPFGQWHYGAASFVANNSRKVHHNTSVASNGATVNVSGLTNFELNRGAPAAPDYLAVTAALPALWTPALTDAEVALLATGVHPSLVAPWSLLGGWELGTGVHNDPGFGSVYDLAFVNAPVAVQGPPHITVPPHERFAADLFAAAGGVPAVYYRLLMQQLGLN